MEQRWVLNEKGLLQREYLSSERFIIRVLFVIVQAQSTHTRSVRIHEVHAGD